MSSVKGCKRCKYNKTIYNIDYERSAQEQMIYYTTDKVCSKCNYNPESKRKYIYEKEYYAIPLDKVIDDMNVDLSKIVHEHNHNKFSHIEEKIERNDKDVCIKLTLIKHYKCDICDRYVSYTEIEEFKEFRDIYDKIEYNIDYEESAQRQKICYTEIARCSKSKLVWTKYENKVAKLDNYPSDMIVDLSKIVHKHNHNKFDHLEHKNSYNTLGNYEPVLIKHYKCDFCGKLSNYTEIHEHNHNKFSYIEEKPTYNNEGNCIKLIFIKHYKCDFCDKMSDYVEIEECKNIYDKTKYKIDYKTSAQKQKIYYREIKTCSKSKYIKPKLEYKIVELNNYPNNINVDLSKIVHEHNHNNIDYKEDKIEYDKEGNCIKLVLIKHYKCDFCDKIINEYTEIEEYNLNNPCERMNELTKERKEEIEKSNNYHDDCNNYKYYDYDNDYRSGASYDSKGGHYYSYHGEWFSGY